MKSLQIDDYPELKDARCLLVSLISDKKLFGNESSILKALALVWIIEDAMKGLYEFYENLESVSSDDYEYGLELLSEARKGELRDLDSVEDRMRILFAHAARINRAMILLNQWLD
jgi:hypothetical protein